MSTAPADAWPGLARDAPSQRMTYARTATAGSGGRDGGSGAEARHDRVREGAGSRRAAEVVRHRLPLGDDGADRALEPLGGRGFAEVPEHEGPGQDERGRVGPVLAGVLRRRAVDRLEDRRLQADVRP